MIPRRHAPLIAMALLLAASLGARAKGFDTMKEVFPTSWEVSGGAIAAGTQVALPLDITVKDDGPVLLEGIGLDIVVGPFSTIHVAPGAEGPTITVEAGVVEVWSSIGCTLDGAKIAPTGSVGLLYIKKADVAATSPALGLGELGEDALATDSLTTIGGTLASLTGGTVPSLSSTPTKAAQALHNNLWAPFFPPMIETLTDPGSLTGIAEEAKGELDLFESSGLVSVESTSACLDSSSGTEGGSVEGPQIDPIETTTGKVRLKIKVTPK